MYFMQSTGNNCARPGQRICPVCAREASGRSQGPPPPRHTAGLAAPGPSPSRRSACLAPGSLHSRGPGEWAVQRTCQPDSKSEIGLGIRLGLAGRLGNGTHQQTAGVQCRAGNSAANSGDNRGRATTAGRRRPPRRACDNHARAGDNRGPVKTADRRQPRRGGPSATAGR